MLVILHAVSRTQARSHGQRPPEWLDMQQQWCGHSSMVTTFDIVGGPQESSVTGHDASP